MTSRPLHPAIGTFVRNVRNGKLDRREFLALASAFGASATTAYGLLGQPAPAHAEDAQPPRRGGTLRVAMQGHGD